jgi:hypothetical protein
MPTLDLLSLSGSINLQGSLTGSVQGTASLSNRSLAADKIKTVNVGGFGTYYPLLGGSFFGDVNTYTVESPAYKYNLGINQLQVFSISSSFTGSLQGTASHAVSASWAPSSNNTASPSSTLIAVDGIGSEFYSGSGFIIVKEYLIPANSLTTSSVLEVSSAFLKNTGVGTNINMYMSLSSSLYVNFLAFAGMTTNQPYSAFYRSFAISGSQILSLNPNSSITTDVQATSLTVASSSIDTTIDNYLLFLINPLGGTSSTTRLLHNRIIAHK